MQHGLHRVGRLCCRCRSRRARVERGLDNVARGTGRRGSRSVRVKRLSHFRQRLPLYGNPGRVRCVRCRSTSNRSRRRRSARRILSERGSCDHSLHRALHRGPHASEGRPPRRAPSAGANRLLFRRWRRRNTTDGGLDHRGLRHPSSSGCGLAPTAQTRLRLLACIRCGGERLPLVDRVRPRLTLGSDLARRVRHRSGGMLGNGGTLRRRWERLLAGHREGVAVRVRRMIRTDLWGGRARRGLKNTRRRLLADALPSRHSLTSPHRNGSRSRPLPFGYAKYTRHCVARVP